MSNVPKYVIVSDFYYGKGWYDAKSKMWFNKSDGVIEIPDGVDTGNIMKYLRFNYLKEVIPSKETKDAIGRATQLNPATPRQLMKEAYSNIETVDEEDNATVNMVETLLLKQTILRLMKYEYLTMQMRSKKKHPRLRLKT